MNAPSSECDVLIVGLGPVGAVMAGLLRVQGLSVVVVEREADIYPLPRAGGFDDEGMRIFQSFGFSEVVLPLCRPLDGYEFLSAARQVLLRFDPSTEIGPNGWPSAFIFHQPDLERALRRHVGQLGAEIHLATRCVEWSQNADGVVAQLAGPGGARTLHARYLIGCDGANSQVRQAIGASVFDYGFSEAWLVVDAIAKDSTGLPGIATQICDPLQPVTCMRMIGDRYRWEFMLTPKSDPDTFASLESAESLMAPWRAVAHLEIERRALYRFRGMVADRWRDGRVLIAGDAAHLMPPFMGQGMCSGFRDASNLAWKIGAILKRGAREDLLDTYQQEREPHVRAIIERSIELGQMICVLDPQVAAERDAALLAMREQGISPPLIKLPALQDGCLMGGAESGVLFDQPLVGDVRLDDKLGADAALISIDPATGTQEGVRAFALGARRTEPLAPPLLAWLESRGAEAVLIRPDRHVFGIGQPDELLAAWRARLGITAAQTS